jgi:4-hydroxythreonine-4-phosphate dehydrogenase
MNNLFPIPIIGITMGDPVGIGPEILAKALDDPEIYTVCRPIIFGDSKVMTQAVQLLNLNSTVNIIKHPDQGIFTCGTMDLIELSSIDMDVTTSLTPSALTGNAMQDYILRSIELAMDNQIDGIATCPITKTALKLAGSKFHGHTELLADKTQSKEFAMMMAGNKLKIVLTTIHIPLAEVPKSLTPEKIVKTIHITYTALKDRFNIKTPKIAVAGLNPHSGEDSMFGNEEAAIISPAVRTARDSGIDVTGPLPPDTVFFKAVNGEFDAVVCMYHDQGLIPFKLVHFKDGVNTTLGLPIIRTSVDHGTAYDISWKGIADDSSLKEAIKMAAFQAANKKQGINEY